jgi:hypothetical protein
MLTLPEMRNMIYEYVIINHDAEPLGNWHLALPPRYYPPLLGATLKQKAEYRARTCASVYPGLSQASQQARHDFLPLYHQNHGILIRPTLFKYFINEFYPEPKYASRIAPPYRASLRLDLGNGYNRSEVFSDLTNILTAVEKQPTLKCRFGATERLPHIDDYPLPEVAGSRFDVAHELNSIFWPTSNSKLLPLIGSEITKIAFWNQKWDNNGTKARGGTLKFCLTKNAGAFIKASVPYPVAQQAFIEFVASRAKLLTIRVRHDLNIYKLVPGRAIEMKFDRVIFYGKTGRYKYDPRSV